jgi:hypothetical protein
MKKIIIFLISICPSLYAQQPWMRSTPHGVYIQFNKPSWAGKKIEVMAIKPGEKVYSTIAEVIPPSDLNMVKRDHEKIFTHSILSPNEETLRKYLNRDSVVVKLITFYPELSYAFGMGYLDKNAFGQYKLKCEHEEVEVKTEIKGLPSLYLDSTQAVSQSIISYWQFPYSWKDLIHFEVERKPLSQERYEKIQPYWTVKEDNKLVLIDTSLSYYGAYDYKITLGDIWGNLDTLQHYFQAHNLGKEAVPDVKNVKLASSSTSRAIVLDWELNNPDYVQTVTLFRSRDYDKDYVRISNLSPKEKHYVDPVEVANEHYFYYFEIKSLFGDTRKSRHFMFMYDGGDTPSSPFDVVISTLKGQPYLQWKNLDKITRGYYVYRREGEVGDWVQISPLIINKEEYLDTSDLDPNFNYFYAVKGESDTYRQSPLSEPVFFQSPSRHKPPYDLHASFSDQKVKLSWEATASAYLVYRKDHGDFELISPEPVRTNYFVDSLIYSSSAFTYAIASLDVKGDTSVLSLPTQIQFPVVVAPEHLGYQVDPKGLLLTWTDFDHKWIKEIKVLRAEEDGNIQTLSTLTSEKRQFKDVNVKKGRSYTYQILTVDGQGTEYKTTLLTVRL